LLYISLTHAETGDPVQIDVTDFESGDIEGRYFEGETIELLDRTTGELVPVREGFDEIAQAIYSARNATAARQTNGNR